jgi:hypothetical protein
MTTVASRLGDLMGTAFSQIAQNAESKYNL